ncbi:MAG TPA: amidase [Rhizomicrobium sp.]|nr:amidase [Rhizomicrobium sp.]
MAEVWTMNAAELSASFAAKKLSPLEVARALLDRIDRLDANINAFCLIDAPTTLAQAKESEARWKKGAPLSALDGVPVAIKDLLLTRGWPTRRGSRSIDPKADWKDDAPAVARLREAGAVLLGKTTTPEYGWKGVTDSPLTGVTRNPRDLEKTPGGSSGGAAASLAARLTPLAIGTDGGGSIRIPASFSGVFGIKPTYGRVAAWPLSPFGTLAHVGPMSRDVTGSAMLLDIIAGPDARDPHQLPSHPDGFVTELHQGARGKRIAFSPTMGFAKNIDSEVAALAAAAARRFESLGAHVEQVDPPLFESGDPKADFRILWWAGAGYLFGEAAEDKKALFDPGFRAMVEEGAAISLRRFLEATMARLAFASAMRQFMERFDFLLTPAVAIPAFDVERLSPWPDDGYAWLSWTPFTLPFNLTQQPAASVPCGFNRAGLPVGLQIAGKMFDDAGVLAAAQAYENADPHFEKVPQGFA